MEGIDIRDISKLTFDGKVISVFLYNGKPTALLSVDLAARAGKHILKLATLDRDTVLGTVVVTVRKKIDEVLRALSVMSVIPAYAGIQYYC